MAPGRKLYFAIPICAILVAAGAGLFVAHEKEKSRPAPNIDPLRDILVKSATERLGAPQLSTGSITVFATEAKMTAELERVTGIARQLQGTAIQSKDEAGNPKLLVQLPAANATKFSALATGQPATGTPNQDGSMIFIDVLFHTAPSTTGETHP